jgi:hypothetical protein
MVENERNDDARMTQQLLRSLATVAVPAALEQRILADFDRLAARRAIPAMHRIGAWLWPGVPAWAPASALVFSLIVGLAAGAVMPSMNLSQSSTDTVIAAMDTGSAIDDLDTGTTK